MADSLQAHGLDFRLWVLCLTEKCKCILDAIDSPNIESYSLHQIENEFPELLKAKGNRSLPEYYFTLSPFWPNWLLENHPEISSITYLDADLEFLSSPQPLIEEAKDCSIGIIEHRFHPTFDISKHAGRFNVAWVHFKRDEEGMNCLKQWSEQCLEWCRDQPEDGKFADQKYLDTWPEEFQNLYIYSHPGANLAPWNLNTHEIKHCGELLLSDNQPVVFYHFHMIKAFDAFHISTSLDIYRVPIEERKKIIDWLYVPYISRLLEKEFTLTQKGFTAKAFHSVRDYSKIDLQHHTKKSLDKRIQEGEIIKIRKPD